MKRITWILMAMAFAHCMAIPVSEDAVSDLYYTADPKIMSATPSTSMTWTTLSTPVQVKFSNPMDASTITVNTANTTCSGSIQITTALANFASCLQFSSLSLQTRNSVVTAALAAELDPNSDYIIKVAGTIADFRGKTLGADATYPFKSGVPAGAEPYVVTIVPNGGFVEDNQSGLLLTVNFSRQMKFASIGSLTQLSCTDMFDLSNNNFVSNCNNQYNSITPPSGDSTTYAINYKVLPRSTYIFRVKAGLIDKFGIASVADYIFNYP